MTAKLWSYHGKLLTVQQIAIAENVHEITVRKRISKCGSPEKPKKQHKRYMYKGEMLTANEIMRREKISFSAVIGRLSGRKPRAPVKKHEYQGEKLTVRQIAEREGITKRAVYDRIEKKRTADPAKIQRKRRRTMYKGEMRSVGEIAALDGIPYHKALKIFRALKASS